MRRYGFHGTSHKYVAHKAAEYLEEPIERLKLIVRSPLVLLGLEGKYDVVVRVSGGGVSGQAGAIRHGLSRALLQHSDENRPVLKKAGFLTRDPRMKERKNCLLYTSHIADRMQHSYHGYSLYYNN